MTSLKKRNQKQWNMNKKKKRFLRKCRMPRKLLQSNLHSRRNKNLVKKLNRRLRKPMMRAPTHRASRILRSSIN